MKRVPVSSRLIHSVFFNPADGKLWIRMHDGSTRLFAGVPQEVVSEMAEAESPGQYYIENVRTHYPRIAA